MKRYTLTYVSQGLLIFILALSFLQANAWGSESAKDFDECGTWRILGEKSGSLASGAYAGRPPDGNYIAGSAHFRVHYSDTLLNDYAQQVLEYAEISYSALVDSLGCLAPPPDGTAGGDSRTDYYIVSASGTPWYGMTVPDQPVTGWPYGNAWTSYVEIVDTMSAPRLSVVTGHEYFHVIQMGYDRDEDINFLEMLSTWAEDYIFDDVNLYLSHLPGFFYHPQVALMNQTYDNVPWAIFLSENFGDVIIRDILQECGETSGGNSLPATDAELAKRGSSLSSEFARFTVWNYFTGSRDDGMHYEEGATFPLVYIEKDTECLPLEDYLTGRRPGPLACNYLTFLGDHSTDDLKLEIVLNPDAAWIVSVTKFISGSVYTDYHYYSMTVGWDPHFITITDWEDCDSLLVIPNVVSTSGSSYEYVASMYHVQPAPPSSAFVLVLDRDGCRRPFDGSGDDFSEVDGEDYPFSAALKEKGIKYQLTDSIPSGLSLCAAVFIIGGYGQNGPNLSSSELQTLMDYMDSGGDVYLESDRLGSWIDPSNGSPGPEEEAFWSYFGCSFDPGDSMLTGNVSSWQSPGSSPIGAFDFSYDFQSPADNYVGSLVPDPGADTLVLDQQGKVRGAVAYGLNGSERVLVTVLLGASRGQDAPSTRANYIRKILDFFDTIIPALSLDFMETKVNDQGVFFRGQLHGYGGQELHLLRSRGKIVSGITEVAVKVSSYGLDAELQARDRPSPGSYIYTLTAETSAGQKELWHREITVPGGVPVLALVGVTPNPSSGDFNLVLDAQDTIEPTLSVYDPLGRLVFRRREKLASGINYVQWAGVDGRGNPLPSGVYFLKIQHGPRSLSRKLVLIR